jgi:hypothetical protein
MSPLEVVLYMTATSESNEKKNKKFEVPAHVMVFDPEKPPFETLHLCIYLRELEEEKEHK